ncbi:hypothetical protein ILUMI_18420 [Ignelater luminosus]|uniref:Protein sleepless n=1 Tax=Ignelater luminosus TaxID=2038154 RepID=A0A8K0CI12_IGNLU|nr:hypothetical protein ILUMI_18420 [Ignelater luminosus]
MLKIILFPGFCLSLRCAHCKGPYGHKCEHPLGFSPPYTECGATPNISCGSNLIMITDMLTTDDDFDFDMNFGPDHTMYVFKGCVKQNYCLEDREYRYFGMLQGFCEECTTDACNMKPKWMKRSKICTISVSKIAFHFLLLRITIDNVINNLL